MATLPRDTPPILADDVRSLVARRLPGGPELPLEPLGEGDFCVAFRRGGSVVRVARHAEAAAALRREACALAAVADALPLPVPRPVHHAPDGGPAFSVHAEVRGEALTRELWLALPTAAREHAAAGLAGFLDALHAIPAGTVRQCELPRLRGAALAAGLRDPAAEVLRPLLSDDAWSALDRVLARAAASASATEEDGRAALLHCDVAPGHVLFDPADGRLTGIIDFGDLAVGDPARDFIYVHEDFGAEMLAAVLRHYRGEAARTLLPRVHLWYLLETVGWTVERRAAGDDGDVEHGVGEITRELATLARVAAR